MFLWVTGRALELGRECLQIWGYERIEEIVWIKTNQLQKVIRTGRTGHWLNHSKEHCLVGVKGNPQTNFITTTTTITNQSVTGKVPNINNSVNRGVDCDVIVSRVRETSRKPDEIYDMIERLSPHSRKLEIFGRMHNVRKGWMTLGNQLHGINIHDKILLEQVQNSILLNKIKIDGKNQ